MKRLLLLIAVLFFDATSVSAQDCGVHCAARPKGPVAYAGPLVCIHVRQPQPGKVVVHLVKEDGSYWRVTGAGEPDLHARSLGTAGVICLGRHWFEKVRDQGGFVRVCNESGQIGARFEEQEVDDHLRLGRTPEDNPVCLFPGLQCPVD